MKRKGRRRLKNERPAEKKRNKSGESAMKGPAQQRGQSIVVNDELWIDIDAPITVHQSKWYVTFLFVFLLFSFFFGLPGFCLVSSVLVILLGFLSSWFFWDLPSFTGFYWVVRLFPACYRVLLGFPWFCLVWSSFIGIYLVLLGFPWFSLVWSSFIGIYLVLLGFTGFCWVL